MDVLCYTFSRGYPNNNSTFDTGVQKEIIFRLTMLVIVVVNYWKIKERRKFNFAHSIIGQSKKTNKKQQQKQGDRDDTWEIAAS